MTPKIERFLDDHKLPTPCIVVDLDKIEQNYLDMHAAFPAAKMSHKCRNGVLEVRFEK